MPKDGAQPAHLRWIGLVTCRLNRASRCGSCIPPSNSYSMAYLKPAWFTAKVFNRIAMATGISNTETLTVTKRGSKEIVPSSQPRRALHRIPLHELGEDHRDLSHHRRSARRGHLHVARRL